jgi:hypothetical protein
MVRRGRFDPFYFGFIDLAVLKFLIILIHFFLFFSFKIILCAL